MKKLVILTLVILVGAMFSCKQKPIPQPEQQIPFTEYKGSYVELYKKELFPSSTERGKVYRTMFTFKENGNLVIEEVDVFDEVVGTFEGTWKPYKDKIDMEFTVLGVYKKRQINKKPVLGWVLNGDPNTTYLLVDDYSPKRKK